MTKSQKIVSFSILWFSIFSAIAQEYNPYERFDKNVKVLTLSNGKYNEFFDTDSIEIIGSAVLNTNTMKVIGFIDEEVKYSESTLEPEVVSRWLSTDPLAASYPFASPYNFTLNNPILFVDYDGRDIVIKNNGEEFVFTSENNSYSGSNEFIQETVQALNHLIIYEKNANAKYKVITEYATNESISTLVTKIGISKHPAANGSAEWNPRQGTLVKDSKTGEIHIQSPAGTLLHEIAHWYQDIHPGLLNEEFPTGMTSAEALADFAEREAASKYGRFYEEGVIVNVENPYYEYYDQATREDHDVYGFIEVKGGFTSNEQCMTCGTLTNEKEVKLN